MNFKSKVIILNAKSSSGMSRKTNQPYSILSVEYLNAENFNPVVSPDGKSKGISFVKKNLPYEQYVNITEAPAVYEMTFEIGVDYKNQQTINPVAVEYVCPISKLFQKQ